MKNIYQLVENTNLVEEDKLYIDISGESLVCNVFNCKSYDAKFFYTRMLEYGFGSEPNQYLIPLTSLHCELIHRIFGGKRLKFADDDVKAIFFRHVLEIWNRDKLAKIQAEFKEQDGKLPDDYEKVVLSKSDLPLRKHQICAAYISTKAMNYGVFAKQGTGKTAIAIARICNLTPVETGSGKERPPRTIIIVPNHLRLNWKLEIERFATKNCRIQIVKGTQVDRFGCLADLFSSKDCDVHIAIIGYDSIRGTWGALEYIDWELVIADESQSFKDKSTKRWHYIKKLRAKCKEAMPLSGTPIGNTILDMWTQLEFIEYGASGFPVFDKFKRFFGKMETNHNGYEKFVSAANVPVFREILTRYSFFISKEEALPYLPKKTHSIRSCGMTEYQRDVYVSAATQMAFRLESELDQAEKEGNLTTLTINHILQQLMELSKLAAGFVQWDAAPGVKRPIEFFEDTPKTDMFFECLEELDEDEKMLGWCWSVPALLKLSEEAEKRGIKHVLFYGGVKDRDAVIDQFNCDDKTRLFLGNPSAGSSGMNLLGYNYRSNNPGNTDCTRAVYYSCDWSYLKWEQSSDRLHRDGTRRPVDEIFLLCEDSIDEDIYERLQQKKDDAENLTNVKTILKSILSKVKA